MNNEERELFNRTYSTKQRHCIRCGRVGARLVAKTMNNQHLCVECVEELSGTSFASPLFIIPKPTKEECDKYQRKVEGRAKFERYKQWKKEQQERDRWLKRQRESQGSGEQ